MTEREGVSGGQRRSRREINQLVVEFESSGLRPSEFCHQHGLALSTLQRGIKRRRREVGGPRFRTALRISVALALGRRPDAKSRPSARRF